MNNGHILINRDFEYYNEVISYSKKLQNINIITYGLNILSNICLIDRKIIKEGQRITASAYGIKYTYKINFDGLHQAINSLAVLGVFINIKKRCKKRN